MSSNHAFKKRCATRYDEIMQQLIMCVFLLLVSCSHSSDTEQGGFEVFRAFPVFESEGSRQLARKTLGCDPCYEIATGDGIASTGTSQAFFIDPDAGLTIRDEQVLSVELDRTERDTVVYAHLREDARESIRALQSAVQDEAAIYIADNLVTVGPFEMVDANFAIALVQDHALAEEIAAALR